MSTFHDLARRVDGVPTPAIDLDGLIAQGERRVHRRRMTGIIAGVAVASAVTVGAIVAGAVSHPQSNGPVGQPSKHHSTTVSSTRELVYSNFSDRFVHFGHRRVPTGRGVLHLDVTDDGFVYTAPDWNPYAHPPAIHDPRVWFSDGGAPRQVGTLCEPSLSRNPDDVVTANDGSLAAWIDCTNTEAPAIVVLDTSTGREAVRRPTARIMSRADTCCSLALVGETLYLGFNRGRDDMQTVGLDSRTGQVSRLGNPNAQLDDLRGHPRGLVIGATWRSGTPTDGIGQSFWVHGTELVPVGDMDTPEPSASTAFSTTTHRPIRLRLPRGYQATHDALGRGDFYLFEWLNDNFVALVGDANQIISCRLSDGSCRLAVTGSGSGTRTRSIPQLALPD